MKSASDKSAETTTTTAVQAKEEPFFGKRDGGGFFESAKRADAPFIQAKLTINEPGDAYEQEADKMADQVVQRLAMPGHEREEPLSPASAQPAAIQTKCETCEEEELQRKEEEGPEEQEEIQRQTESAAPSTPGDEAGGDFSSRLSASKGGGSPLPKDTRADMESAFGADFSNVRIHTGGEAAGMSKNIHAQAFTHGSDIYFNEGKFDGGSTDGKRLLAHELVHVGQQGNGINQVNSIYRQELNNEKQKFIHELQSPFFDGNNELELVINGQLLLGRGQIKRNNSEYIDTGSTGDSVKKINQAMILLYPNMAKSIEKNLNYFSKATKKAVKQFQKESGLPAKHIDGIVGELTLRILDEYYFYEENNQLKTKRISIDKLQFVNDENWEISTDETILHIISEDNHYLIPGKYWVYNVNTKGNQEPIVGQIPVGRGATNVFYTSKGKGFFLDVGIGGGISERKYAMYSYQLRNLLSRMNIKEITNIIISHIHDDHTNAIYNIIKEFKIQAKKLFIFSWPFYSRTEKGRAFIKSELTEKLINDNETRLLGYHRSQEMNKIEGIQEGEAIFSTKYEMGEIILTTYLSNEAVQKLERESAEGEISDKTKDAASRLIVAEKYGKEFKIVLLGDLRGKDYLDLYNSMEQIEQGSFRNLFSKVKTILGFNHHLGVIETTKDLEGIIKILEVTAFSHGELTISVQTRNHESNRTIAASLQVLGVNVIMPTTLQANSETYVMFLESGDIEVMGKEVLRYKPTDETKAMLKEYSIINEIFNNKKWFSSLYAVSEIESNKEFEADWKSIESIANNFRELMRQRVSLSIELLKGKKEKDLNINTLDMKKIDENSKQINKLMESPEYKTIREKTRDFAEIVLPIIKEEESINYQISNLSQKGANQRLVELIVAASPEYAKAVLRANPNISRARLEQVLTRQARLAEMANFSPSGAPPVRKSAGAGILAGLVIVNDIGMGFYEIWKNNKIKLDNEKRKSFEIFLWYYEKGIIPDCTGYYYMQDVLKEIKDISLIFSKIQNNELEGLTINKIPDEGLDRLRLWLTYNVITINDYFYHFIYDPTKAIKQDNKSQYINQSNWLFVFPKWDENNGVSFNNIQSDKLTEIMDENIEKMTTYTEIELDKSGHAIYKEDEIKNNNIKLYANEEKTINQQLVYNVHEESIAISETMSLHVKKRLKFKENCTKELYSFYNPTVIVKDGEWFEGSIIFYEILKPYLISHWFDIPEDKILVIGANFNTYSKIKVVKTPYYSIKPIVEMPSKVATHGGMFFAWDEDELKDEQLQAKKDLKNDPVGTKFNPTYPASKNSGGEIHYPGIADYNYWGFGLVDKASVEEFPIKT